MINKPKESDWKKYSAMVEIWRERLLKESNEKIISILTNPKKSHTDKFWDGIDEAMKQKKRLLECFGRHARSQMFLSIFALYQEGIIQESELEEFSQELQANIIKFENL